MLVSSDAHIKDLDYARLKLVLDAAEVATPMVATPMVATPLVATPLVATPLVASPFKIVNQFF